MTKEELVRQAAKCFPPKVTTVKEEKAFIEGFVRGAEWMQEKMQQTNEGQALLYAVKKTTERTKREVIKKAVEWLRSNIDKDLVIYNNNTWKHLEPFINEFKQAMEE